jgi:hypothetical protein
MAAPSQPILTIFGTWVISPTLIIRAKFHIDRLRGFGLADIPENRMFPYESLVVLNAVHNADALASYQAESLCLLLNNMH